MKETAFSRNFNALFNMSGKTQDEIASALGVDRVTIYNWRNGRTQKPKSQEIVDKLKEYFGVDDIDLFGYNDGYHAKVYGLTSAPPGAAAVRGSDARKVPVHVLGAAHAGDLDEPWELDGEAMLYEDIAKRHPRCYALRVNGDCMDKVFTDHDHIFVDPDAEARDGSIVVASIDGQTVVRRLKRGTSTAMLVAESHEPHEDIIVRESSDARVLGTVFWWQARCEQ